MSSLDRKIEHKKNLGKYTDEEIKMWDACYNLNYYSKSLRMPFLTPIMNGVCRSMIEFYLPLCGQALQSDKPELKNEAIKAMKNFSKSGYIKSADNLELEK